MSIKGAVQIFQSLPNSYKATIGVGLGIGVGTALSKAFSGGSNISGLPKASNLNGFSPVMTRKEAELILNLPSDFTQQDVQKHHRILMALHHPDKGGSSYVATKINESRDFLALGTKV